MRLFLREILDRRANAGLGQPGATWGNLGQSRQRMEILSLEVILDWGNLGQPGATTATRVVLCEILVYTANPGLGQLGATWGNHGDEIIPLRNPGLQG